MHDDLRHLYVFCGGEIEIMNIYLNQMQKVLGIDKVRADSVASIYAKCTTKSMFGDTKSLYVIRNDTDITKEEKFYETLENNIRDNYIVLIYDKIDSRLKFGKFFKEQTIVFESLPTNVLVKYIQKQCALNQSNAADLSNKCSGNYDLILSEISKINHYAQRLHVTDIDNVYRQMVDEGVIYQPEEADIFEWVDSVMCRDVNKSLKLAKVLEDNGTQSIMMLGTLYNAVRATFLIKLCNGKEVVETTGLDKGAAYYNRKYTGNFSIPRLKGIMRCIAWCVDGIKSGKIEDYISVPYVLVHIFNK